MFRLLVSGKVFMTLLNHCDYFDLQLRFQIYVYVSCFFLNILYGKEFENVQHHLPTRPYCVNDCIFKMTCDMRSTEMWQTVCEHWKIPNYCYAEESTLKFNSIIPKKSINVVKDCLYLPVVKVQTTDSNLHIPNR